MGRLILMILFLPLFTWAQTPTVRGAVEKDTVYLGEPFLFQVQIEGDSAPPEPDLSVIKDFSVQSLGGQENSRSSVSIINGQVTKDEFRGYIYSYKLTASSLGSRTIPSIAVVVAGKSLRTNPITIQVREPEETDNYKLRASVSKTDLFVGEPATLTLTWYLQGRVREAELNLPFYEDPNFELVFLNTGRRSAKISIGSREVPVAYGEESLDGVRYQTFKLKALLIPKKTGQFSLSRSTVSFSVKERVTSRQRRLSPFDGSIFGDFFDNDPFFGGGQASYRKFVVPSNEVPLTVKALPDQGRPANFNGAVGQFEVTATANPTNVRVGDPITLKTELSGYGYIDGLKLPALQSNKRLEGAFKTPKESSAGTMRGKVKVYTQTIRPRTAQVSEVPAIEFPYFDPVSEAYRVAKSEPIPLTVAPTKIVTLADGEGEGEVLSEQVELEVAQGGIAHNYEGDDLLKSVSTRIDNSALAALLIPPVIYLLVVLGGLAGARKSRDERAKTAYKLFSSEIDGVQGIDELWEILSEFLNARFDLPKGALTENDLLDRLKTLNPSEEVYREVGNLIQDLQSVRYAGGGADSSALRELSALTKKVASMMEKEL